MCYMCKYHTNDKYHMQEEIILEHFNAQCHVYTLVNL